jgi:hypothetical protein
VLQYNYSTITDRRFGVELFPEFSNLRNSSFEWYGDEKKDQQFIIRIKLSEIKGISQKENIIKLGPQHERLENFLTEKNRETVLNL